MEITADSYEGPVYHFDEQDDVQVFRGSKSESPGREPFVTGRPANQDEAAFKRSKALTEDVESPYHATPSTSFSSCC
ncbi:MAG: hypothetical protein WCH43_17325 [Verrucomicrobiota bacterium]